MQLFCVRGFHYVRENIRIAENEPLNLSERGAVKNTPLSVSVCAWASCVAIIGVHVLVDSWHVPFNLGKACFLAAAIMKNSLSITVGQPYVPYYLVTLLFSDLSLWDELLTQLHDVTYCDACLQSSGISSVLESLVGKDMLPRGTGEWPAGYSSYS